MRPPSDSVQDALDALDLRRAEWDAQPESARFHVRCATDAAEVRRAAIEMGESVRVEVEKLPQGEERDRFLELSLRFRIFWEEASEPFLLEWAKLAYRMAGIAESVVEEMTLAKAPPPEVAAAVAAFAEDHSSGRTLCEACDGTGINKGSGAFCSACNGDGLRPRVGRESIKKSDRGEGRCFVD
jgi:hypothetical protein